MIVYAGNAAGEAAIKKLRQYEMGRLVSPSGWRRPVPGIRWCVDNDAYRSFKRKIPWDEDAWGELFHDDKWCGPGKVETASYGIGYPDFIVVPDKVCDPDSLDFSRSWFPRLWHGYHWYLAVQPGMSVEDVADAWEEAAEEDAVYLRGIFVGGDWRYKWRTIQTWRRFTRDRDAQLHVGGLSGLKALVKAELAGADSVDSSAFGRFGTFDVVPQARRIAQQQRVLALA